MIAETDRLLEELLFSIKWLKPHSLGSGAASYAPRQARQR
jgi:hypothetical protein